MIAIFDNDGTICDTQTAEDACFAKAIERVTGRLLPTLDWTTYQEPTSSAIVRELLADAPEAATMEQAIESEFVRLLEAERPKFPGDFIPIPGAIAFIERLAREKTCSVGIATGCFARSARFKLSCCGIAIEQFPHATSSDTPRRSDIIRLAAQRAGFPLSSVIYFGDGAWDVHVSRLLGIPMIGIGRRITQLRALGVEHTFPNYLEPDRIISALHALRKQSGKAPEHRAEWVMS